MFAMRKLLCAPMLAVFPSLDNNVANVLQLLLACLQLLIVSTAEIVCGPSIIAAVPAT